MFSDASSPLRGSPASERSMPGRCQRGASDALGLCGYNHPDLMLLDLGLPDAHGIDVLRQIRSSRERFDPELPVLVLSGRTSESDRLRGFEAGADDYLANIRRLSPFYGVNRSSCRDPSAPRR